MLFSCRINAYIRSANRSIFFALGLLCIALTTLAQNREVLGEYKLGIIGRDQNDAIYLATHLGAKEAALDLSRELSIDVEVIVLTPDSSQGMDQSASLSELFIADVDGFIISPAKDASIAPAIKFAQDQGQEVVFFETALEGINPLISIMADEEAAGRLAGERMLKELPTRGRAVILTSETSSPELDARMRGVRESLGYRKIEKVVATPPDYVSAIETIRREMEADHNHQIKGWVFLDDWPLLGMPVLPWKAGKLPCVAIQSSPTSFVYLEKNYVEAIIVHPYYDWGYASVEALVNKLHKKQKPDTLKTVTAPQVIDWRNIETYRENWKSWLR